MAALGLIDVIGSVDIAWSSLVATLLLALLTLAFFLAAQHSTDKRFGWLLSASVAAGLTIADVYNLVNTAPAAWAAVLVICIALLVVRRLTRRPQPGCSRTTREAPSEATRGLLEQQIEQIAQTEQIEQIAQIARIARAGVAARDAPSVSHSPGGSG